MGGQLHAAATLPSGKTRHPLYRRLGGPQGRSGRVRKILPSPGFDPRTVQHVASRYTDWATGPIQKEQVWCKTKVIQSLYRSWGFQETEFEPAAQRLNQLCSQCGGTCLPASEARDCLMCSEVAGRIFRRNVGVYLPNASHLAVTVDRVTNLTHILMLITERWVPELLLWSWKIRRQSTTPSKQILKSDVYWTVHLVIAGE